MIHRWLPLALLAACGYPASTYTADAARASCAVVTECTDWYPSEDACLGAVQTGRTAGCRYDQDAARRCVSDLRRLTCPAEGALPPHPSSCEAVWTDCDIAVRAPAPD